MIKIFKNSTEIETNLSEGLEEQELQLNPGDTLYIGFYKALSQLYVSLKTPNANASKLTIQRSTADSYINATFTDHTRGFKKSNFIIIDKAEGQAAKDEGAKGNMHWLKITSSTATSTMVIRLLDIVFSSEDDLVIRARDINKFFPRSMNSHILSLVESRKHIVRMINNSGKYKINGTDVKLFTAHDFQDIEELRDASTLYALYSIYLELADAVNDGYYQKAQDFLARFHEAFKVLSASLLTLDEDDNGEKEVGKCRIGQLRFYR